MITFELFEKKSKDSDPLFRLHGQLLYNIGKLDQCQRYFEDSLNTKSNNQEDVASLHLQLGRVHGENGAFDHELNNYIHALELMT